MTGRGSVVQRFRQLLDGVAMWRASPDERPLDARFEAEAQEQSRRGIRIFCLFALALLVASAADSYVAEPDRFLVLLRIRLISAAALVGIIALLSTNFGARWPRAGALAVVLVISVTI